ncbi:MAG TPA: DNA-binding response regulator [Syntrophobacteraceae bacterium]|nr:DNA-binding response regulator [Syntrophobacteraceae bacterium]
MESQHPGRVLVVEDDERVREFVCHALTRVGYSVEGVGDGPGGLRLASSGRYDVLIVDVMLPGMDGLELLQRLRRQAIETPVLILSGKDDVGDRVAGLDVGADDYLVKPFEFAELLARLRSLLRRARSSQSSTRLQVADVILDLVTRRAFRGDEAIELRPIEFHMLECLMRRSGEIVSRKELVQHVWGYSSPSSTNVVEVHICRLREKIEKPGLEPLIQTVRGAGYILGPPNQTP